MNIQELSRIWQESDAPIRYARINLNSKILWTRWRGLDAIDFLSGPPWKCQEVQTTLNVSALDGCLFLAPCEPTKVVGLAHNYKSLVGEMESYTPPLLFLKSNNALAGYGETVTIPPGESRSWLEVELSMVIGRRACNLKPDEGLSHVFGFTVANDMTTENLAGRDHHLAQSKSRNGFCPCGPFLVPGVASDDLKITSNIDGEQKQEGRTADRLLTDAEAIAYVSQYLTLEPGDLVITGTCDGWKTATLTPGCTMEVSVENIGTLRNPVA